MEILQKFSGFIGTLSNFEVAEKVLIGAPMDYTVSFRTGSRMAPMQIRLVSDLLEEYSFYQDKHISDAKFFDAGDVILPIGNVIESLNRIEEAVDLILQAGKKPFILGGEHLVTYPVIKAMSKYYKDLVVIQFDAHADLREDYCGEDLSHATVMRKVANIIGPENLYQFGIRSGTEEEFKFGRKYTNFFPDEVLPALRKVLPTLHGKKVFISLDIDVVDPAYAPGTGTLEAGGISSREMITAIHEMAQLDIVGMDLLEVSPPNDVSDMTSILAAKIIREALIAY